MSQTEELRKKSAAAIDDRNRAWESQNQSYRRLETIVRGELFEKAKRFGIDLWPSELTDVKTLLEMFLESGQGVLRKEKLASLFESIFQLDGEEELSETYCKRVVASAGLLCAIATSNFSKENNHLAEIEAWVLYISYVFALVEGRELSDRAYKNEFEIATQSIYNSLANLCDEIREREHLVEGDPLTDSYIYSIRMTCLMGLMSIYALWRRRDEVDKNETDDFLREFCKEKYQQLNLWGEAAIPQWLAFCWYCQKIDATKESNSLLCFLITEICIRNGPSPRTFLANPYYEAEDILPHILELAEEPLMDSFKGISYALEGLVHLSARRDLKEPIKRLWPEVTRLMYASFESENFSDFYKWRNEEGINKIVAPKHTQDWEELKALSFESEGSCIPLTIKNDPILLLLFLCVYPHRMNAEIMRWLDTQVQEIPWP